MPAVFKRDVRIFMRIKSIVFSGIAVFLLCGCKFHNRHSVPSLQNVQPKAIKCWPYFSGRYPLVLTTDSARLSYMVAHSWDDFDFAATVLRTDSTNVIREFADFIHLLNQCKELDRISAIESLMQKASASRIMLDWFVWQAMTVLNDPNSPLRDDELCIPILQAQRNSGYYDFADSVRLEYRLELMQKNRVGHKAADFGYVVPGKGYDRLYSISAEYTLIFFNNPGCGMCQTVTEELACSPLVWKAISERRLVILAVYPDNDRSEWEAHRQDMPKEWINSYDEDCLIEKEWLYDISAIPSIYLLDRDKTVLLKDITDVKLVEEYLQ